MRWRRVVGGALGVLAVVVGVPVGLLAWTFSGIPPIPDGQVLPGGAVVVKDGYVAAFVIPLDGDRAALVDTGNDADGKAVQAALAKLGLTELDVVAILLTHGHPDHTAACGRFTNAAVYAGAPELPVLAGTAKTHGPLPSLFGAAASTCAAPVGVVDGQVVELGGAQAQAYALPGHTAGSTAWRVGTVVYLGDGADATESGEVVGAKWLFSDDQAQSERSLVALAAAVRDEGVTTLAFAHSGLLPGSALAAFAASHAR